MFCNYIPLTGLKNKIVSLFSLFRTALSLESVLLVTADVLAIATDSH
jgi:hypothetical protein